MTIPHPIVLKFERLFALTASEREAVSAIPIRPQTIGPNQGIVREGDRATRCIIILSGFADTSKVDTTGRRQVAAYHFPGDMPDLLGLHLEFLDSDIRAISECSVAFVDHSVLRLLCESHHRLASALWRSTLVDASIYREWVINVGQRQALSRIAHLFCEMMVRMADVGQADNLSCTLPLTQANLGEATGLSIVHVNRQIKDLRDRELISFDKGRLTILDWPRLADLADFREDYLHLGTRDR